MTAPAVTGYRQLSAEDIAMINEVKAMGAVLDALQRRVVEHIQHADSAAAWAQAEGLPVGHATRYADALRASEIAKRNLQTGLMWLTRAVAQPDGFA